MGSGFLLALRVGRSWDVAIHPLEAHGQPNEVGKPSTSQRSFSWMRGAFLERTVLKYKMCAT